MPANDPQPVMRATITGAGAPIVLLHGVPGSSGSWEGVAGRLRATHTVIVPDLLGFGRSDRPAEEQLRIPAQADALADLLDSLDVRGAVIAGHDYGGPVALTLAERRRDLVSALAVFATNAFGDTPIPFPISTVVVPGIGSAMERVLFSGPILAAMMVRACGRPRLPLDVRGALGDRVQRRAIRQIFAGSLRELATRYADVETALARFDGPMFVGWGERDPFFPVEVGRRTAARARSARFRVYGSAGHYLPEERPDEVAKDIGALATVAASP